MFGDTKSIAPGDSFRIHTKSIAPGDSFRVHLEPFTKPGRELIRGRGFGEVGGCQGKGGMYL